MRGVVFDSLAGAPLAGATVQIGPAADPAQARTVVADSVGRFRFDSLGAGRWVAVVFHPSIDALGIDPPTRTFDVPAAGATSLTLGPPSAAYLRGALCSPAADDSSAALIGIVRDADAGRPVESGKVSLAWEELSFVGGVHTSVRRVSADVRQGGLFLFCGVPTDADLTMRAETGAMASGDVAVSVRPKTLGRYDLAVGRTGAQTLVGLVPRGTGHAQLVANVTDDKGHALSQARLFVLGVEGDASTSEGGVARLDELPSGSWTVEARSVGFTPARATVTLASDEPARVTLAMHRVAPTLERVVVRGKASSGTTGLDEFLQRRSRGLGVFLTPEQIEAKRAMFPTDLLQGIPGLLIQTAKTGRGYRVQGRAGCAPTIWINGHAIQGASENLEEVVSPSDIRAIEVYRGPNVPAQFATPRADGCEVVILWTR